MSRTCDSLTPFLCKDSEETAKLKSRAPSYSNADDLGSVSEPELPHPEFEARMERQQTALTHAPFGSKEIGQLGNVIFFLNYELLNISKVTFG